MGVESPRDAFAALLTDARLAPDVARERAYALAAVMNREDAEACMAVLVATEDHRVRGTFLLRGDLLDRLEDALVLTPEERCKKWASEQAERDTEAHRQRTERDAQGAAVRRRVDNRRYNREALRRARTEGGEALWHRSLESLAAESPVFWYGMALERLEEAERRLVLALLDELASAYGRGRFPAVLWTRAHNALAMLPSPPRPPPAPLPPPAPRRRWGCGFRWPWGVLRRARRV